MAKQVYTIKELHEKLENLEVSIPYPTLYRWIRNGMVGKYNSSIGMLVGVQEVYKDLVNIFDSKRLRNKEELRKVENRIKRLTDLIQVLDKMRDEIKKRKKRDEELTEIISILIAEV